MSESNNKGAVGEALFIAQCFAMNLVISKPFSDSLLYDVIVDNGERLLRVQVKTLYHEQTVENHRWKLSSNTLKKYKTATDVLAVYIQPYDLWYIIPSTVIESNSLWFYPTTQNNNGKNEIYRNNWDLLYLK